MTHLIDPTATPGARMRHYPPPILDRKIRFALVGCGRIARNHMNAMREHADRCELAGVYRPAECLCGALALVSCLRQGHQFLSRSHGSLLLRSQRRSPVAARGG